MVGGKKTTGTRPGGGTTFKNSTITLSQTLLNSGHLEQTARKQRRWHIIQPHASLIDFSLQAKKCRCLSPCAKASSASRCADSFHELIECIKHLRFLKNFSFIKSTT
jgi:hypothetical protein